MQRSISQTSGRLVRQLRRRDRRLAKLQRNCDVVTAILQAASLKRREWAVFSLALSAFLFSSVLPLRGRVWVAEARRSLFGWLVKRDCRRGAISAWVVMMAIGCGVGKQLQTGGSGGPGCLVYSGQGKGNERNGLDSIFHMPCLRLDKSLMIYNTARAASLFLWWWWSWFDDEDDNSGHRLC